MNSPTNRDEQLERLVSTALRDLPTRRAPATLENKVFAELARRAALPWWRLSFANWPTPARVVFIVIAICAVKVLFEAMTGSPINSMTQSSPLLSQVSWIVALYSTLSALFRSLPQLWIYGGLALFAGMYLTLFGVSAAAYRTLYASR